MNDRNGRRTRIIALGACAVCAQTLFIREILGIVTGTELVLGLALASWLFWIGAGGLAGGRFLRQGPVAEKAFSGLALTLALSVPLIVLFIRVGRSLLVVPPGAIPDILPAAGFILVSTAPFGLLYGAVYNSASAVVTEPGKSMSSGISGAYILEAAGSVAGGAFLSLIFLAFLTQLAAAFAVSAIVLAVFLMTSVKGRRAGWVIAVVFTAAGFGMASHIDRASMALVFSGQEVTDVIPSRYAELCLTRNRETVSVYSGGVRLFTFPDPEAAGERVHIPLLAHHAPESVLLIGGGPGGGLDEAVNHPGVTRIDWIELDDNLPLISEITAESAGDRSIARFLKGDGRFLIGGTEKYDVIIVNVPEPVNIRWNRYFTSEFFDLARRSLLPGGILALRHGASENYISPDNAAVLGLIRATVLSSFKYVDIVPGGTVFFIASDSPVEIGAIPDRLLERRLGGRLLTLDALSWRVSEERREYLASLLEDTPFLINSDLHPSLVSYELVLQMERSGSTSRGFLKGLFGLPPWILPAVLLAVVILIAGISSRQSSARTAVCITGFCGMTVQLSLMIAYQTFAGILYHTLVVITALFMAGAALGAYFAGKIRNSSGRSMLMLHILMAVTAVSVPLWLKSQASALPGQIAGALGFMALSAVGGLLAGGYYRTVVDIAWPASGKAPPAIFYSWDMFGACAGALIAGTLLIPISGLVWTSWTVAALHIATALLVTRKITAEASG